MNGEEGTVWELIDGAASGDDQARERFGQLYQDLIRCHFESRWRGRPSLAAQVDDAVQEVFVECFREKGALDRVEAGRTGGFRGFLYGVVRNIAMRHERKQGKNREEQGNTGFDAEAIESDDETLSYHFDRRWALDLLRETVDLLAAEATDEGAARRVEILRKRFRHGMSVIEIAREWGEDNVKVHRQYERASREFKRALAKIVVQRYPGAAARIEDELAEIARMVQ